MLASELKKRGVICSAVLGLARGGMPVAFEVASALRMPLDVVVVKKLRSPFNEEMAIGAICADGTSVLREDTLKELGVSREYVEKESRERLAEAQAAEQMYRGDIPALDLSGASVVLVDDGIATGATMEAAVLTIRKRGAKQVILAVPLGSLGPVRALLSIADTVVCLATPRYFWAVGQSYRYFPEVSDQEVRRLLMESRATRTKVGGSA
jgi:predicted phosphoribosyltransferase